MTTTRFKDRHDAGRRLAVALAQYQDSDPIVLGLPRGGMPVASEVAEALQAPLDVLVVRKLGVPFHPELAMGAIGEGGALVVDERMIDDARVGQSDLHRIIAEERAELDRRVLRYRQHRPMRPLAGRTLIVVDDGIATGSTARAALQVVRSQGPKRIVLAVPVAAPDSIRQLRQEADKVVVLVQPPSFNAVGSWYDDFGETTDEEVARLIAQAQNTTSRRLITDQEVMLGIDGVHLRGHLTMPTDAIGLVVFAHGSGSSHTSPRNRLVADQLIQSGIGALLFDLLTPKEADARSNVFNIELLAHRLSLATAWLRARADTNALGIAYFGASTGSAAALWAAAEVTADIVAVVSRGGRPDLAMDHLGNVTAPTLLIVGGDDDVVLQLNRAAAAHLRSACRLDVVPGACHLFGEPGTLEAAARLARDWFIDNFAKESPIRERGDRPPARHRAAVIQHPEPTLPRPMPAASDSAQSRVRPSSDSTADESIRRERKDVIEPAVRRSAQSRSRAGAL